ncbi:NmrA family protein [Trichoderma harzianum]|uniref:NmrA family protein n=1 Tax=Trichoderma harzianum TaxID=5544 RepID=A0A0F9XHX4_TRIHA|nr:NmrA family protein [Trichoderma harzianum]
MSNQKVVLVLGGVGAQNSAVVRELAKSGSFLIRVMSRNIQSEECVALSALSSVELLEGNCYDEAALVSAFQGVHACFVNTNGFAIGEKAELYWGIRIYEIAYWSGVAHFVYSSLPYVSKKSGYDPAYRVPFVDAKGKVCEYLKAQPTDKMNWSILETGPYPEASLAAWAPTKGADGIYVFRMPIGSECAVPFVALADLAWFARYILQHPHEFKGDLLSIAITHTSGDMVASAFTAVTGEPARFEPLNLSEVAKSWPATKIGIAGSPGFDDPTLMTMAGQLIPWYTIWQESGGNTGLWTKDYNRLDKIHPNRIRSIEQWMRADGYSTQKRPAVLKTGIFGDPM